MAETPLPTKNIDPAALASLTTDVLMSTFDEVHEAAEHLLGRPVFTHELARPEIAAQLCAAVVARFPDMPTEEPADWRATAVDLRARYGAAVAVEGGPKTTPPARDQEPRDG